MRKKLIFVFYAVIGGLIYLNALWGPFVYDDEFWAIPSHADNILESIKNISSNRYLTLLTFHLNYWWHGTRPFGYHLVNCLIHIVNAILVYYLIVSLFKTPQIVSSSIISSHSYFSKKIAFFSALIFLVHPIQTQAVSYISQRFVPLATLFYLSALIFYLKTRLIKNEFKFYALSLICVVLAMKSKEISFTLPFVIILSEFILFDGNKKDRFYRLIPFLLTLFIIPISFFIVQYASGTTEGNASVTMMKRQFSEATTLSRLEYLSTQFRVIVTYLRLLFFPTNQHVDYYYPISHSLFQLPTILSMVLLSIISAGSICLLFLSKKIEPSFKIVSLGIFWFFICLSIESSLIPIKDVIFEHRIYLPSIGFIFSIVTLLWIVFHQIFKNSSSAHIATTIFLSGIALILSFATYKRNQIWKDEIALYEDEVQKNPNKAGTFARLGFAYATVGRWEDAMRQFQSAIKMHPYLAEEHTSYGTQLVRKGDFIDKGILHLQIALKLKPDLISAYHGLSEAFFTKFKLESKNIQEEPNLSRAQNELLNQASFYLKKAIAIYPTDATSYIKLGLIYKYQWDQEKSMQSYQKALEIDPHNPIAYNNLGVLYYKRKEYKKALDAFETALKVSPNPNPMIENRIQSLKELLSQLQKESRK